MPRRSSAGFPSEAAHDLGPEFSAEAGEAVIFPQNISMDTPIRVNGKIRAPASGERTIKRHKQRGGMTGVDPSTVTTLKPVTVVTKQKGDVLKSAFSQFKKWFDGSRTLTNSFSFIHETPSIDVNGVRTPVRGQRGVLLIPLRTDASIYGTQNYGSGSQSNESVSNYRQYVGDSNIDTAIGDAKKMYTATATDDDHHHCVGDLIRTGKGSGTVCEPHILPTPGVVYNGISTQNMATTKNLLVPGMQLLHVENASWGLNDMKVIKQTRPLVDNSSEGKIQIAGSVMPLLVHGPWNVDNKTVHRVDNYISRRHHGPRQQQMPIRTKTQESVDGDGFNVSLPAEERYEIQAGRGYIEFTIKNQGSTQAVVEIVLFKPTDRTFNAQLVDGTQSPAYVENVWSWLRSTNGLISAEKRTQNQEKLLQISDSTIESTDVPSENDILTNPYVNFLPESSFRASTSSLLFGTKQNPDSVGDGSMAARSQVQSLLSTANVELNKTLVQDKNVHEINTNKDYGPTSIVEPIKKIMSPYAHVGRAYAVIPACAKRTIRIPLPKIRYDPSADNRFSKLGDDIKIPTVGGNSAMITPMNPHSLMCAMALNGARSDFFERPGDGPVFRGQDFTEAKVYVDAVYKETVYPCAVGDCKNDYGFNFGKPLQSNIGSTAVFSGRVVPKDTIIPTHEVHTSTGIGYPNVIFDGSPA